MRCEQKLPQTLLLRKGSRKWRKSFSQPKVNLWTLSSSARIANKSWKSIPAPPANKSVARRAINPSPSRSRTRAICEWATLLQLQMQQRREAKNLAVPLSDRPVQSLIHKPLPSLEMSAREEAPGLRIKTLRHSDCKEVGHDNFDKVATDALQKNWRRQDCFDQYVLLHVHRSRHSRPTHGFRHSHCSQSINHDTIMLRTTFLLFGAVCLSLIAKGASEPKFRTVNVDTNIGIGYGLAIADIDGDRKPDIILCDKNQIVWYQNPGWQKHVIAENLTKLDHVCVAAQEYRWRRQG